MTREKQKQNSTKKEMLLYVIFGIATTLLNMGVQFGLTVIFQLDDVGKVWIANPIAWVAGVIFAYVTNRIFVFQSKATGVKAICVEAGEFTLARLITLGFDTLVMWALVGHYWFADELVARILNISLEVANDLVSKALASVIVIILNYVFSKWIIFRKKEAK